MVCNPPSLCQQRYDEISGWRFYYKAASYLRVFGRVCVFPATTTTTTTKTTLPPQQPEQKQCSVASGGIKINNRMCACVTEGHVCYRAEKYPQRQRGCGEMSLNQFSPYCQDCRCAEDSSAGYRCCFNGKQEYKWFHKSNLKRTPRGNIHCPRIDGVRWRHAEDSMCD